MSGRREPHRTWRAKRAAVASTALGVVFGVVSGLVVGACSSEDLAERVAENAIERGLEAEGETGDVDIDIDGGEIRVETPDGSAVVDIDDNGQGNISISGQDGEGDVDVDLGGEDGVTVISSPDGEMVIGASELPDDFPAAVPVPTGLSVQSATSMDGGSGTAYIVTGSVSDEPAAATDAYLGAMEAAGFTVQSKTETPDGTFFDLAGTEWRVSGGFYADPADDGASIVSLNVFREG